MGDEKLDLRVFVKTQRTADAAKRGLRFYLHNGNWAQFRKLMDKVTKAYKELV
jgi:hypothetical protein